MALENRLGILDSAELAREEERLSKRRAVELFESGALDQLEPGTVAALWEIHRQLFQDVYAFAGEFVGDYISMRNAAPALVRIEAMCDSRVLAVGNDRLEAFYRTDAACERLGRRVAERLLLEVYERLLQRYAATPQERYEALLARCPGLLDLVPLQELASFLGVRPETLSRIRRRIR